MSLLSRAVCLLHLGAITGCALSARPPREIQTFLLDVSGTPARAPAWPGPVQVRPTRARACLADVSLLVRRSAVRYERDAYHRFLVAPTEQLDALLALRWSGQDGPVPDAEAERLERTLTPTLERFEADFTDPNAPRAEVQIRFRLTEYSPRDRTARVILDRRFGAARALTPDPSAEAVVIQLSACLSEVLETFERFVNERWGTTATGDP